MWIYYFFKKKDIYGQETVILFPDPWILSIIIIIYRLNGITNNEHFPGLPNVGIFPDGEKIITQI